MSKPVDIKDNVGEDEGVDQEHADDGEVEPEELIKGAEEEAAPRTLQFS